MRIFHPARQSGLPLKSTPGGYEDFNSEQRLYRYQRYSHCSSRLQTKFIRPVVELRLSTRELFLPDTVLRPPPPFFLEWDGYQDGS